MMRILVLSDSHGAFSSMRKAIQSNRSDAVIFLGDGLYDWEENLPYISCEKTAAVKGNCDLYVSPSYPLQTVEKIGGTLLYCTHGHSEGVKYGLDTLKKRAREKNAGIALFGHTHQPMTDYDDGLYLMNPGSVRENSCGIVDITPQGILCFTKKIIPE